MKTTSLRSIAVLEASRALATVEVDTYEGTVYLNGPIPSEKAKREAEALAWRGTSTT